MTTAQTLEAQLCDTFLIPFVPCWIKPVPQTAGSNWTSHTHTGLIAAPPLSAHSVTSEVTVKITDVHDITQHPASRLVQTFSAVLRWELEWRHDVPEPGLSSVHQV